MSATRPARLVRIGATPEFRRAVRLVAWAWTVVAVIVAAVFTVMTVGLPISTWYVFIGGRSSGPQLMLVPTVNLVISAWVVVVVGVVMGVILRFVKGAGASWLLAIRILIAFGTAIGAVVLLSSAIPQLGFDAAMPRTTAQSTLLAPANTLGFVAALVALVSLIGVPYFVGRRASS